MDLKERFDQFEDDFIKFEAIAPSRRLHERPDICAFLLLDVLAPQKHDMVVAAEHDQIWLGVDCEALNAAASDEDIRTLARCGVMYDEETESLSMFV